MVNTVRANPNHRGDFHPVADHMTEIKKFTKGEIR